MKHRSRTFGLSIALLIICGFTPWTSRFAIGQDTLRWSQVADRVLSQTPAVRKARAELQFAKTLEHLQFGAYLPALSLGFSSSRNEQGPRQVYLGAEPFEQSGQSYFYHSTGLNLSYVLFDWGNRHRKSRAFEEQSHSKQWALVQAQREALQEAFSTYCDLLAAQEALQLIEEEQTMLERQHTLVSRLANRGLQPSVDLKRVEVEQRNLQAEIYRQRGEMKNNRQTLSSSMDINVSGTAHFAPVKVPKDSMLYGDKSITAIAENAPGIRKQKMIVHSAQTEARIIHWEQFPQLSLAASYQRGNERFPEVYGSLPQNWNTVLSMQLSFSLFNRNTERIQQEKQSLQVSTASWDLKNQRRQLRLQFQKLLDDYNVQVHQYHLQQQNVHDYEVIYKYEQEAYQAGSNEYRDYLSALRAYVTARQNAIKIKYQMTKTHFRIELFTGRWDHFAEE